MNKILYLGPILDGTGYSHAGIEYLRAMLAVGLDVVAKPIKLNNAKGELPVNVRALLNKSAKGCNICIQHCLPSMFSYDGHFEKNIGLFAWETSGFGRSNWAHYCNLMDEIWVISKTMKQTCQEEGVDVPIKVIPHALDLEKYNQSYEGIQRDKESFYFYTIGEFNRRKNYVALLKAFLTEFDPDENVELVIKTNKNIDDVVDRVCSGLKLYKDNSYYKKPIVISNSMSEAQIMGLHYNLDCFVSTSYGEAFCLPAFDALGFGKPIIVPCHTAFYDFIPSTVAHFVSCFSDPVFGCLESNPELYSAKEEWEQIDIFHLCNKMRQVYKFKPDRSLESYNLVENFSHNSVGNIIKQALTNG